jgi:hypothetical protein
LTDRTAVYGPVRTVVWEGRRRETPAYPDFASPHDVFRAAHWSGGIYGEHLAYHQPVEQHAHGGQPLFDRRRRKPAPEALDPGRDVHRFDVEQPEAGLVAPVEEFRGRPVVSAAGVRVTDVRGEEFDEAAAGVRTARGDQRRHTGAGRIGQEDDWQVVRIGLHRPAL